VQAVLMARIDRLPPAQKRLLQAAAVIGKDVPFSVLHALTEGSAEGLQENLMQLQTAEFLYETRLLPEREYTFKHALTHEVTYRSLLKERQQALHARIVEVIEAMENERLVDYEERLAYHAFRGEVWDKAFTHCRQAGTKAIARSVHREAVLCFEQALEALQHLPESRATREQAIDIHLDLRSSLVPLGELDRIIHYLREAEALAMELQDSCRLGLISCFMINYFWVKGEPDRAIEAGQRALSLVPAVSDFAFQINAQQFLGQVYCTRGDYRQAMTFLEKNVASLTGDLLQERFGQTALSSVISRTWLILCLAELGTFAEGIRLSTEAMHIAEAANHPYSLTFAYFGVGLLYLRKGELATAIPILERGLQLCQTWNLPIRFPSIASTLGYVYALSGRVPEAVPLLEHAVEQATSLGRMDDHALWVTWLSEVYLLAGRIDEAVQLAERALALSRQHNEWGHQAYALCLCGEIAAHYRRHSQQAEEAYKQAQSLAQARDMRPLLGRCHYGLGTLYGETDRGAEARTELSAAMTLFRAMDMAHWLSRAQAVFAKVV
jgi:tetratricopeptide (TPR) repeat protein